MKKHISNLKRAWMDWNLARDDSSRIALIRAAQRVRAYDHRQPHSAEMLHADDIVALARRIAASH